MNFYKNDKIKTAYYSVMGENHLKSNGENQDVICFEYLSDDKWFAAIADGVSSASHSKEGAIFATEVVKELAFSFELHDKLDIDELKVWFVRRWKKKILNNWNEYATTLNFVYYSKGYLLVGQIGDGLIWLNVDGETSKFCIDEDFYSSETDALSEAVRKSSFILELKPVANQLDLYMVSDGVGKEILLDSRDELGDYLRRLLVQEEENIEKEIGHWFIELDDKNGDDKSIAFVSWED